MTIVLEHFSDLLAGVPNLFIRQVRLFPVLPDLLHPLVICRSVGWVDPWAPLFRVVAIAVGVQAALLALVALAAD